MPKPDIHLGKFDILATWAYAKGLLDGLSETEAKEPGLEAAVGGAQARRGN
jgi:hypothetical protein